MADIHNAILNGDLVKVKAFVHQLNEVDENGNTPLHLVLIRLADTKDKEEISNYIFILEYLFAHSNLDVMNENKDQKTPIQLLPSALYQVDFPMVLPFVQTVLKAKIDCKIDLFHAAIYAHHLEIVDYLLHEDKELINVKDKRGFSPYVIALGASAINIENYFYQHLASEVVKDACLKIDLSQPQLTTSMIKAAIFYEDDVHRDKIERIIDELYADPNFRPVLDLVAASLIEERNAKNKPIRIFVAKGDNVGNLTPKSGGFGDFDIDAIILRTSGLRDVEEIKGTFIHELTHLAALLTYGNNCKPFQNGSDAENYYLNAIKELIEINEKEIDFTQTECLIKNLLANRIEQYSAREINLNLEKGSLSLPEWLVGVPQGFVLFSHFFESPTNSIFERRARPMIEFWRKQFNTDVRNSFDNHPNRKLININIDATAPQIESKKIILTTFLDNLKQEMFQRYLFCVKNFQMVEGYSDVPIPASAMAHAILFGDALDKFLERNKLPENLLLAEARALAQHPLFSSPEYKKAHQEIYNLIAKEWERKKKPAEFSLKNVGKKVLSEIQKNYGNLLNTINQELEKWVVEIDKHCGLLSECIKQAFKLIRQTHKVNKKDLQQLESIIFNYLYKHLAVNNQNIFTMLPSQLAQEIQSNFLKTADSNNFLNLLSAKKNEPMKMIDFNEEILKQCLHNLTSLLNNSRISSDMPSL